MKPKEATDERIPKYSFNVAENKEYLRKMALASDAEYFLFVDADVVLPEHAISEFVLQLTAKEPDPTLLKMAEEITGKKSVFIPKKAIAGYYPMKDGNEYIMARFVADNTVYMLTVVEKSLTKIDFAGLGCLIISRDVLEKVTIRGGCDKSIKRTDGLEVLTDDSIDFCDQIFEQGVQLWADGSVVCKHLKEVANGVR